MSVKPPKLKAGDKVMLVSPASTPQESSVRETIGFLESLGLLVEIGQHAFDTFGFLAGTDGDRLSDINSAIRDPEVRAIIATRGGKGAYRIADQLDFQSLHNDPKLLIGFSEITMLHLSILKHCEMCCVHGAAWAPTFSQISSESFITSVFSTNTITIGNEPSESTFCLTTSGTANGRLIGGNQEMLATSAGWALPSLDGAILLIEAFGMRMGQTDRHLTMLENSGALAGLSGIAVGQYTECGPDETTQGDWTINDVLRDRLERLKVPILGGLPIGHGAKPIAVPIGSMAKLDAEAGTLIVEAAVS